MGQNIELMDIFAEIAKIADWYANLKKGYQNIEHLLDVRRRLSGLSYSLAEHTATFKGEQIRYEFSRKLAFAKIVEELAGKKDTDGKKLYTVDQCRSKAERDENVQGLASHEIEAEIAANRCKLLLGQVNEILSALSQQISYLKDEKRNTPQTQP